MKIGKITNPNQKGQIVIPKAYRDELGITANTPINIVLENDQVCLKPVKGMLSSKEMNQAYSQVLKKTRGAWLNDKDWDETQKQRQKMEEKETERRKKAW